MADQPSPRRFQFRLRTHCRSEIETMATYNEIADWVKEAYGFTVKTCWIGHVKKDHGFKMRLAPNRKSSEKRVHPCPPGEKRLAIENAFRHFKMI
jgi:hypothetical protein